MKAADQSASVVTAWMDGSKHSGCCCCGCCNTVYRHMVAPLVSWLVGRPLFLLLRWTISDMDPPCVGALVRSGVRCGRAGCFICNISNKRVLVESRGSLTIHLHTSTAGFISTTRYKAFGFLWICTVWFDVFHVAAGDRCRDKPLSSVLSEHGSSWEQVDQSQSFFPEPFQKVCRQTPGRFHYVVTFLLYVKTFFDGTAD